MRLKRWESPRREGRNDKGKGGSARKRQLKKQRQMLRQRLKEEKKADDIKNKGKGEDKIHLLLFYLFQVKKQIFLSKNIRICISTKVYL
ncbi:MAG: hypothetical protein RMX68_011820 [Aulosira sp. ZfuVER01]|nr:hypothetical protein [Aulosira sp. ZfuVER01]MDZ7997272.1 hypothetical protein [Aulosira sp. DedVER01a]MDZ8055559.1 hypothetical protein [Aulosira sp. ZfuCHP01]